MRISLPKLRGSIRSASAKVGLRKKLQNGLRAGAKYATIRGALSLGAEGASTLVRHAEGPQNMEDSQAIEFTD